MTYSFDTTVKNGLPTTVYFEVSPAEEDVGIMSPYVNDIWLEAKGKRAEWLEKRLTTTEWTDLEQLAMEEYYDVT